MLGELGKWLRCAGYDTVIIQNGEKDREILDQAIAENRILLTRDRHFLTIKGAEKTAIYFSGTSLEEWVKLLKEKLHLKWNYKPLSRCLLCNSLLEPTKDHSDVPPDVQGSIRKCPHCQKNYWNGSHTENILSKLNQWDK